MKAKFKRSQIINIIKEEMENYDKNQQSLLEEVEKEIKVDLLSESKEKINNVKTVDEAKELLEELIKKLG